MCPGPSEMKRAGTFDLIDLDLDLSWALDDENNSFLNSDEGALSMWSTMPFGTDGFSSGVPSSPKPSVLSPLEGTPSPLWCDETPPAPSSSFGSECDASRVMATALAATGINSKPEAAAGSVHPPSHVSPGHVGGSFALRLTSPIETLWYAERTFPSFTVDLVATGTVEPLDMTGWTVAVSLLDAYGGDASDKLSQQVRNNKYALNGGSALINAIRFCGVSSKAGGAFRIVLSVTPVDSDAVVANLISAPLRVLSYRLYHAPKVSQESLRPNDSVSKMKGIGSQYAKRLGTLGIHTIVDLASIDTACLGTNGCDELLQQLRRQRGALTHSRLMTYINQAAAVCDRFPTSPDSGSIHKVARSQSSECHPRKKRRLSILEATHLIGTPIA